MLATYSLATQHTPGHLGIINTRMTVPYSCIAYTHTNECVHTHYTHSNSCASITQHSHKQLMCMALQNRTEVMCDTKLIESLPNQHHSLYHQESPLRQFHSPPASPVPLSNSLPLLLRDPTSQTGFQPAAEKNCSPLVEENTIKRVIGRKEKERLKMVPLVQTTPHQSVIW